MRAAQLEMSSHMQDLREGHREFRTHMGMLFHNQREMARFQFGAERYHRDHVLRPTNPRVLFPKAPCLQTPEGRFDPEDDFEYWTNSDGDDVGSDPGHGGGSPF